MSEKARLPPFAALRAFHAAATHQRFRGAARSLGITESAVSHQVRRLEEYLHVALFERTGTGARLTAVGRRYLEAIEPAIRQIQVATEEVTGQPGRIMVRLTLHPTLAVTWLIPHLDAFERQYPNLNLQLVTTIEPLNLKREQIDLAIRHGKGQWPSLISERLLDETAYPVCAPGYLDVGTEERPEMALQRARLIVNTRSPEEWEEWCRVRGLALPKSIATIEIQGQEDALQAAERGHGVAIGRYPFVGDRLARGVLVAPFGSDDPSNRAYYLCRPANIEPTAAVRRVERWLKVLAQPT
ncbi:LysR substrate-binding domain-containing protein [Nitratireductor sp. ZSWI3]|uniref:LysR substrate-binding domain-containing protein n=1 Tax=Nitratireductor sp. ZSWI3 TaxID=2966359 RepID=UPI0021505EDC|nr:LysR substrate-binding domain-containing protein [Nitratireductor sp. ZSWI3]MCR4267284.1 LysR substrate-binding domain-containing protein [Nitratireductor sp. ZSWI3]